jgi:hypothetical protein
MFIRAVCALFRQKQSPDWARANIFLSVYVYMWIKRVCMSRLWQGYAILMAYLMNEHPARSVGNCRSAALGQNRAFWKETNRWKGKNNRNPPVSLSSMLNANSMVGAIKCGLAPFNNTFRRPDPRRCLSFATKYQFTCLECLTKFTENKITISP